GDSDVSEATSANQFFLKHEFAIRRLHSLTGILPLGLYMCVHLATNASMLNGVQTFQWAVFMIHAPGKLLPLIEWGLIFLPLIFHAGVGVWIARTGRANSSQYQFTSNRRYSWQRWTGFIALIYLFLHILHLHGWFHADWWISSINNVGLGQFRPYNAGSTLADAMNWGYGVIWPPIYLVGVLSCVYHFVNGIWTAGITWGLWVSPPAQERATKACVALGVVLTVLSLAAWAGAVLPDDEDVQEMRVVEDRMYENAVKSGMIPAMEHKRSHDDEAKGSDKAAMTESAESPNS
ncbi:MAG: succinate dehydrogenase cytochrome b558 subunit, partial [Planctomycetota bacterium]